MKINFLSALGALILTVFFETDNEWDASVMAQNVIEAQLIVGAVDFQILRDT